MMWERLLMAAGAMQGVSARYWRLYQTGVSYRSGYPYHTSIAELQCFASEDCSGTNLLSGLANGAFSASSQDYGPAYEVHDGLTSNGWTSASGGSTWQWLAIDFGVPVMIRSMKFHTGLNAASEWSLQYSSNGSNWTELTRISHAYNSAGAWFTFPSLQ